MAYSVGQVMMYDTFANLPTVGNTGALYFAVDTNLFYHWNGAAYVAAGS